MKLFVILPRFPYPTEKGDKLRAYNQIKILSQFFDIHLCCITHCKINDNAFNAVKKYCKTVKVIKLNVFNVIINLIRSIVNKLPLQVGYYYSCKANKIIQKEIQNVSPDHIYCQLIRTAEYVKNINIPKTIDYQDVFSKGVERRIVSANILSKLVFKYEYKRLLQYEKYVFDIFDNKTIISEPDRDLIPHNQRNKIIVVPNGVDQNYLYPIDSPKTHDLIFTGNMAYPPNINCAEFIVKKVFPIVKNHFPSVKLMLAGASPHIRVKALMADNITVTGWVDDIRQCYSAAKVFIAPMQIGTGLQNKLLEAMAMKLPCVTSSLSNAALKAKENKEILIGDTPEDIANQIIKLLKDSALRYEIATNGYNFITKNFSWAEATEKLINIINNKIN